MRRLPVLLALLAALSPSAGNAQGTSGFVPPGHWSLGAVDRLHALGLAPRGTHRGERSRSIAEVRAALGEAARRTADAEIDGVEPRGDEPRAGWAELAYGYLARFEEEFPQPAMLREVRVGHLHVAGGMGTLDGDVRPGRYTDWEGRGWTGATPRADRTEAAGGVSASLELGRYVALGGSAAAGPDRTRIEEAYGLVRLGAVGLWGGRRMPGYGPGTSAVTLSGTAPFDGGGLHVEPMRLPWVLRHLGPTRLDLGFGKLPPNGPLQNPWMVVTRGTIEPHPRLGLGISRAAMASPQDNGGANLRDLVYLLIGKHIDGSNYDNQIASVEAWFRPPTGAVPLLLYVDWGFEDSAGAWRDVPGVVAGVEVGAVPGAPWLALQLEHARFGASGNGNPPWYRHPLGFHEGWTSRGQLVGHPLGGHGQEWLAEARSSTFQGRLLLSARGFARRRDAENVYAPQRAGQSRGGALSGDIALRRAVSVRFEGTYEDGAGWHRTDALALLRLYLPQ